MAAGGVGAAWYSEGLAFSCLGCGDCCRGPGGYVWVSEEEAGKIASALDLRPEVFAAKMLRMTISGLALVDDGKGDCPLLDSDSRCRVYPVRPFQCRTWPWWGENLASRRRWDEAAARCPGMNRGPIRPERAIEAVMAGEL
ncbi:MAG: YkgJ family cysteine cluster protein [Planctomycetota bacterium]|jgi:Fe-S-cluster containining protein|nr:YkgJ family cysteine cluster protein [Planctomycetota bacterium]